LTKDDELNLNEEINFIEENLKGKKKKEFHPYIKTFFEDEAKEASRTNFDDEDNDYEEY
jgi:hypothetical protein